MLIVADTGGKAAAGGGFAPGYCLPQTSPRQSRTSALDEKLSFCRCEHCGQSHLQRQRILSPF